MDKWKRIGKRRGEEGGYDWRCDLRPAPWGRCAPRPVGRGVTLHRRATSDDGAAVGRPVSNVDRGTDASDALVVRKLRVHFGEVVSAKPGLAVE